MSDEKNNEGSWLSEELATIPSLQKFKSPQDLAKSYVEMQTLLGGKTSYPGEGASDEDWEKFYAPITPSEYDLKFEDLKSVEAKEILTDDLKSAAKKLGLTNKQAQGLLDKFRGVLEAKETEVLGYKETLTKEQENALTAKFGKDLAAVQDQVDDYIADNYGKDMVEVFKQSLYKNPEALAKLFDRAKETAQDKGLPSDSRSPRADKKEQLESEVRAFITGTHSKFGKAALEDSNPAHSAAVARLGEIQNTLRLYE